MADVALVTGGAVRIGRAIVLGLAERGYDVVVNYHTSAAAAREVVRRVETLGRRATAVRADVSDADDVSRVADAVREGWGRLDLLVNNASTFRTASLLEMDDGEWDAVMATNLKGPYLAVKATADLLAEAKGSVINLLDLSALQPWTSYPHHAVSKAGLLHLTRIMARELAPRIRVNAIAPGTVLPPEGTSEEELERERERSPLGTLGTPEDVVRTVLFLADSPFITGEVVVVDGGRRLER